MRILRIGFYDVITEAGHVMRTGDTLEGAFLAEIAGKTAEETIETGL